MSATFGIMLRKRLGLLSQSHLIVLKMTLLFVYGVLALYDRITTLLFLLWKGR